MDTPVGTGAEVEMVLRGGGQRALFIVEVGDLARGRHLLAYFDKMPCEVRPIAVGPVVVCAARVEEGAASPFDRMAEYLRDRYPLSICEPGFSPSMYRVALQLARDSEGELRPLDRCSVCGAADPFPTTLVLREAADEAQASFCTGCVGGEAGDAGALGSTLTERAAGVSAAWSGLVLGPALKDGGCWRFAGRRVAAMAPGARR